MKRTLFLGLFALSLLGLSACGTSPNNANSNGIYVPSIDNSIDLSEYSGSDYQTSGDETYYLSDYISFIMEVRGYYQINVPFTLDQENENLRVYDDMYFYEGDFFQLMSKDYRYIWATLKDESTGYLSPLREEGQDIQVDVKVSGIYKIVLDTTTMIMDFEYKSAIETPRYYPFKTCSIGTLVDGSISYSPMSVNPSNEDEFVIRDYAVTSGKLYAFYDQYSHTSMYKLTIQEDSLNYVSPSIYDTSVVFNVDGEFHVYVNRQTYELRVEVADPSKFVYHCLTYAGGEFITLEAKDPSLPYIFEYDYEATSDVGGYGVVSDDLPKFYNKSYKEYVFTVEDSPLLGNSGGRYYFKKKGLYRLTLNLFEMTLQVEAIGE